MADQGDFFVGYLKTPLRLVRFVALVTIALLIGADALALLLYRAQERRQSGDWEMAGEVSYEGVLIGKPYPVLLVPAGGGNAAYAVLPVSDGKMGAPEALAALDGKSVRLAGYPLIRDGLTVLQLAEPARALAAPQALPAPVPMGRHTLTGEIVDSKCYLGAMIPGEGKVHQSCAALCLLGDIPALFVTREGGRLQYRLLADAAGAGMPALASTHAGQPLTLTGEVTRLPGIEIFAVPRASLD
jgi:hypothetical protein